MEDVVQDLYGSSMKVTVKLFAHFRNIAGADQVRVELVEGATSHICRSPFF